MFTNQEVARSSRAGGAIYSNKKFMNNSFPLVQSARRGLGLVHAGVDKWTPLG